MKSLSLTIRLLPALLLAGCTTAQVNWSREMRTRIDPNTAVAVVALREGDEAEDSSFATEAAECIQATIRRVYPTLRIIAREEFRRVAFPSAPAEPLLSAAQPFASVLEDPQFRNRIAPLGLRYLIAARGFTVQQAKPIIGAAGAHGGAFTVLGAVWDRRSRITATVFDLKQFRTAGEIAASASGKPWLVCVGLLVLCAPIGAPAFTESKACKEVAEGVIKFLAGENHPDINFLYGKDDRVLYSYSTKAVPSERYQQALSSLKHPLGEMDQDSCPSVKTCVEGYIEEARKRAEEVGYSLNEADEKSFHADLEMAGKLDEGEVTKEEAFRQKCATQGFTDHRKPSPASPDLYNAFHRLTDQFLNELKDGRGSMKDTVSGYVEQSRELMTGFNRRLTCTDEETFQEALQIAKDVDEGKVTRDDAYGKLLRVTTRHLVRLYQGMN